MESSNPERNARAASAKVALVALLGIGLWSGGRLTFNHYLSGEACPVLGGIVPACYVAFAGYLLMSTAIGLPTFMSRKALGWLFWLGLFAAGGLALVGSGFEAVTGHVCPRAFGWLPMCYVSLAASVAIGLLYRGLSTSSPAALRTSA